MRIADAIIKYLQNNKVEYIFGIPTTQIAVLNDAMNDCDIELIVVKNESAATYSACKYADLKKDIGVTALGGGVGVNNAINGIADAHKNKVPMLLISSAAARSIMNKHGIQELITTDITKSITKYSETVMDENQVLKELKKAMEIALTPPYGPVHISIPQDILYMTCEEAMPSEVDKSILQPEYDKKSLKNAIDTINESKTGAIMVGRGSRGLTKEIKELSRRLQWPIITTPNAKGIVDAEFEFHLGNYGWSSAESASNFIDNKKIDCLLILGSGLGVLSTRIYKNTLTKDKKVIQIDWDESVFNRKLTVDIPVNYDLELALKQILEETKEKKNIFVKEKWNSPYVKNHTGFSVRKFVEDIVDIVPENTCFTQEIGEHMNFVFRYLKPKENMDFQCSMHYACMGVGLGGAMGAYLARPDKSHAVIVGDGTFFMNGMEILTAKEYSMPIIYFVINNSMFGYIEHGGEVEFGRIPRGKNTFTRFSIAEMSKAMGIEAIQITENEQLKEIKDRLNNLNGPLLVELITDGSEFLDDPDRWDKE
ncbi:MAG: thiamine pyrophosphate-binding protein [Proteocatella sp.]